MSKHSSKNTLQNKQLKKIQNKLTEFNVDAVLLFNSSRKDPFMTYVTQTEYEYSLLLIMPQNVDSPDTHLYVSTMEYARALTEASVPVKRYLKNPFTYLTQLCKQHHLKTLGFNASFCSVNELKYLKKEFRKNKVKVMWKDLSKQLSEARQIKTTEEINNIRKACHITDVLFTELLKHFALCTTEQDVAQRLHRCMEKYNVTPSFDTIVASGKHASMPHHRTSTSKLLKGFCVIDFGVKYKNYCSDMTRTIYLGTPTTKDIKLYHTLYTAQTSTLALMNKGKKERSCSELYNHAAMQLGKLKKYFIHGLGHGVGIEIHEPPSVSPKSKERLKENMIVTVEPGIYLPNKLGIRIEDTILITKKGIEILTKSPKDLICLQGTNH